MALQDWEVAYAKKDGESPIYRNKKTYDYIVIAGKQLGRFDNFTKEKFPFILNNNYEKWFDTRGEALRYLKHYMQNN